MENVEARADKVPDVDGIMNEGAVNAEVNLRKRLRDEERVGQVELIGDLDIPLSTEAAIDFGKELSLVEQVSNRLSIARNSDEGPAKVMRFVLKDFKDQLGSVGIRYITEQVVARASLGDPELKAGIQAEQEKGYWRVPENVEEVLEEDRQAIVKAANMGDREEMDKLRVKMPVSYELTVDAIFKKALEQAGNTNLAGALEYLNKIPGMKVSPALTLGDSPTLIRTFE